jgi:hypothetical protein
VYEERQGYFFGNTSSNAVRSHLHARYRQLWASAGWGGGGNVNRKGAEAKCALDYYVKRIAKTPPVVRGRAEVPLRIEFTPDPRVTIRHHLCAPAARTPR